MSKFALRSLPKRRGLDGFRWFSLLRRVSSTPKSTGALSVPWTEAIEIRGGRLAAMRPSTVLFVLCPEAKTLFREVTEECVQTRTMHLISLLVAS